MVLMAAVPLAQGVGGIGGAPEVDPVQPKCMMQSGWVLKERYT
jgi:hypothetical protein